jgi:hypothetical protein
MKGRTIETYLDLMFEEKYIKSCHVKKNKRGHVIGKTYTVAPKAEIIFQVSGHVEVAESQDEILLHARGTNAYPTAITLKKNDIPEKSIGHRSDIPFTLIKRFYPRKL